MDRSVAIQVAFVAVQSTSQVVVFRSLSVYLNYMEEGIASLFFVASVQVEMCKEALLFLDALASLELVLSLTPSFLPSPFSGLLFMRYLVIEY